MDEMPVRHKSATHAIIIMMLVALMAVETATLGYVITKPTSMAPEVKESGLTSMIPPVLYVEQSYAEAPFGNKLFELDRATGQKKLLMDRGFNFIELLAVPQVGYDGRVFVNLLGEGSDFNPVSVYAVDLTKKELDPVALTSFAPGQHIAPSQARVSPDQTKIAYIPFDNSDSPGYAPAPALFVFDLLTGETTELARLSEMGTPTTTQGYTFIQKGEDNAPGGVGPVALNWKDDSCVIARVYYSPLPDASITNETFCVR